MVGQISVVINTLNEEENIARAIKSVEWASEILVCDMYSEDKTVELAKRNGAKVIYHKKADFVEPARNFAVSKTSNEWILILDADEEIPRALKERLIQISRKTEGLDYVRIPRKNIIFGSWIQASGWWPDYQIRFFKKGKVKWTDKIHHPPHTEGLGIDLDENESLAIIHQNYQTVSQFISRMNRYTSIEAKQISIEGYKFVWRDVFRQPVNEFLSRFFAKKGYQDGLHGLVLSLLQAFSLLIVYLKIWELSKFKKEEIKFAETEEEMKKIGFEVNYWIKESKKINPFRNFLKKLID